MGSISRMDRCKRFRMKLEDKIVARSPHQMGDFLEVTGVSVGMTDDGTDVTRLYIVVKNKRTGDESELTTDGILFSPEEPDEDTVARLHGALFNYQGYEGKKFKANRATTVKLLKGAKLINPKYKEPS